MSTMKRHSYYKLSLLRGGILLGWFLLLPLAVTAQDQSYDWTIDLTLAPTYDSNILRYSDKYLELFENRQDEGRFHIQTSDDVVWVGSARISRVVRPFGGLRSTLSAEFRHRLYTLNSVKNWSTLSLGWRQEITPRTTFAVSYSFTPDYYVRHYRDDDWIEQLGYVPATFQSFSYSSSEVGISLQQTFLENTRLRVSYALPRYYYNEHFTEYDSKNVRWGFELNQPLLKILRVNASYRYTTSDAKGYDASGETKVLSNDADGSYEEDVYNLSMEFRLLKLWDRATVLTLEAGYAYRCFTTTHFLELDPTHAGRQDHDYDVGLTCTVEPWEDLSVSADYSWHKRRAETNAFQNQEYMSDEKDYYRYQIGLEVVYTIRF